MKRMLGRFSKRRTIVVDVSEFLYISRLVSVECLLSFLPQGHRKCQYSSVCFCFQFFLGQILDAPAPTYDEWLVNRKLVPPTNT